MNKILLKIKKACIIAGILSALFFAIYFFISMQKCGSESFPQPSENEYLLQPEVYKPPLIKIPFTKDKAPVSKGNLPIPKRDVKTTIVVKSPVPGKKDITIIIDKKGKVYKSTDTPDDAKIEVTQWKPALFDIKPRLGFTGNFTLLPLDIYPCLSLDILRIGKLYFGGDLGAKLENGYFTDIFYGVATRYMILPKNNILATVGWEFKHKTLYIGITIRF